MVFVPRMELIASDREARGEIAWDSAISEEAARKALALKFYRFAEIAWNRLRKRLRWQKRRTGPFTQSLFGVRLTTNRAERTARI